jgi:hypothetical protein
LIYLGFSRVGCRYCAERLSNRAGQDVENPWTLFTDRFVGRWTRDSGTFRGPKREKKMNINHWDKAADGNVICWPLIGVETAPMLNGMAGLVRLEYLTDPNTGKTRSALQVAITVNEVTRLIAELQILEKQLRDNLAADVPRGKPS